MLRLSLWVLVHLVLLLGRLSSLVLQVGGFDVPLATALCKNLPAENTQR